MKSYKEFAEEAEYLTERGRGRRNTRRRNNDNPGRPSATGRNRGGGAGDLIRGAGNLVGGAGNLGWSALKGAAGLAGNLLKGALNTADKASKQSNNNRYAKGSEESGLDKIT